MTKDRLLAIDAGTGSVRAVLFDLSGKQLAVEQEEWSHKSDPRFPGSMDFDWEHNWDLARGCVRRVLEKTGEDAARIAAVSTTCMREGILLYDKDGKEIWACANVDSRAGDEVAELIRKDPALEKELYALSGEAYALGALPRLLWVKNKLPEVYEKTARIGMFNDWLIYKLTGVMKVEPSNGSTTGIFQLKTRGWDPSIASRLGLRDDIFGETSECGEAVAAVNTQGAADTGLCEGTLVVSGGGDCQCGCIGVGVVNPMEAAIFGGSFWQYEYNTASPDTDPLARVRVNAHAVKGVWQYEALAFNPGLVMRWYRDAFCTEEKLCAQKEGGDAYDYMNMEAEKIPAGCFGMQCAFSDVMNFTSWRHAAPTFTNFSIDPDKFNRFTFYRAIMENTAIVTKGHMALVHEATGGMPKEVVFAGGASKSDLWCRILASVLGIPVRVPEVKEATALGCAMLAGLGAGIYTDINDAVDKCVRFSKTYEPDMADFKTYSALYENWLNVYRAQLGLADKGCTTYMWSAPGVNVTG
ncbi:MAG: autoinducer-2 kinase [Lachnospiraceae bacterium]|nr:autoinducer-2 kinase [Lachnospiraceae bacterium]